jgi:integrase
MTLTLNWKKIARGLPRTGKAANDRAPTIAEIRKLMEYPDRRIKLIVKTMVASGVRIGAWDYLKWKHIAPIFQKESDEVIAAKLIVYAGDSEEYYTFITPEAYISLKEWMDFRGEYGEIITGESWVMRDLWQTTNIKYGAKLGLATCPRKLRSSGIKRILERALWEQGLRQPLSKGMRRHEWKAAHGLESITRAVQSKQCDPLTSK